MPNVSGGPAPSGPGETAALNAIPAPTAPGTASVETLHQFMVALAILLIVGLILIEIAGASKTAGNFVIGLFGIMLLVQLVTRTSPFTLWIASHPLTPNRASS